MSLFACSNKLLVVKKYNPQSYFAKIKICTVAHIFFCSPIILGLYALLPKIHTKYSSPFATDFKEKLHKDKYRCVV